MQENRVRCLGQADPLEKGVATHSSTLAWRIPWTEEPGGLQSMRPQRVRHDWSTNTTQHKTRVSRSECYKPDSLQGLGSRETDTKKEEAGLRPGLKAENQLGELPGLRRWVRSKGTEVFRPQFGLLGWWYWVKLRKQIPTIALWGEGHSHPRWE